MPMKLRDGKLYKSLPTSRMLLRDGKVVQAERSILLDKNGLLIDTITPEDGETRGSYSDTPKKAHDNETEAGNIVAGERINRPKESMALQQKRNTRRSERINSQISSEFFQKTKEVTLITSSVEDAVQMREESYIDQHDEIDATRKTGAKTRFVQSIPRGRLMEVQTGFTTSTPVNDGSFITEKMDVENCVTFSERITRSYKNSTDNQIVNERETGFTRLNSIESKTPPNRVLNSRSKSGEHDRSFEDNVFEDLSKPLIYNSNIMSADFSEIESLQDQTDFPSLKGNSFSNQSKRFNPEVDLDHARWSKFHDWRRQWYLNRWNAEGAAMQKGWVFGLITTVFYVLTVIQKTVMSKLMVFISFLNSIWSSKVRKTTRTRASVAISSIIKQSSISRKLKRNANGFCCFICLPVLLSIVFGFLIIYLWPLNNFFGTSDFDLTNFGVKNARKIMFDGVKGKNLGWQISQVGFDGESHARNPFPVVFYIRNTGKQMAEKKIATFKALSTAAYNVIIPILPVTRAKVNEGWRWTFENFNESTIFLWGEDGSSSDMQELAKAFCAEGLPPSGVIIESDGVIDSERRVKEFEVWTCNCTTVTTADGSPFSYTHVRCPLTTRNVQVDVINCLQALKK